MSPRIWYQLAAFVLFGLFLSLPTTGWAVDKKTEKPTKKFETIDIKGTLDNTDPPDPARNTPCKIHRVDFQKDKVYQIDMISTEFDTFLRLENDGGQQLAMDDDGGGNLNARIVFTAPADGNYKIFATSFNGFGKYQLLVKEREPKTVKGKEIKLDQNGAFTTNDQLTNQDDKGDIPPTNLQKTYKIELKAGQNYIIDMIDNNNQIDPYLHILDSNGQRLLSDDDGGGNLNARIAFTPQADGTFYIIATNLRPGEGAFTLSVRKQE